MRHLTSVNLMVDAVRVEEVAPIAFKFLLELRNCRTSDLKHLD